MNWREVRWQIPLDARPEILILAIGNHPPAVARYLFPHHWCLHFYRYDAELIIDGKHFPVRPGHVGVVSPGAFQEYRRDVRAIHAVAVFKLFQAEPASRDSRNLVSVAAMQDWSGVQSHKFENLYSAMEEAITVFPVQLRRAEVRLWDILWQTVDETHAPAVAEAHLHPQVPHAMRIIELSLNKPLQVAHLAREVGLSHDRLTKLFRAALNTTVTAYIRERRVARAHTLLIRSSLPIKSIAAEAGLGDLHSMNKAVRQVTGYSPRHIREHGVEWAPLSLKRSQEI